MFGALSNKYPFHIKHGIHRSSCLVKCARWIQPSGGAHAGAPLGATGLKMTHHEITFMPAVQILYSYEHVAFCHHRPRWGAGTSLHETVSNTLETLLPGVSMGRHRQHRLRRIEASNVRPQPNVTQNIYTVAPISHAHCSYAAYDYLIKLVGKYTLFELVSRQIGTYL